MVAEASVIQQQLPELHYDVIVIGSGPVGMRFIAQFLRVNTEATIAVFGDEPWMPYNRVNLTALLTGVIHEEKMYVNVDATKNDKVTCYYNNRITQIDRHARVVTDSAGMRHAYKTLVLATGSSAFVPNIVGTQLKNVFTFRDLSDAQKLMSRIVRSRHTVVIGGGLLGLEAARAMQRFNTTVTIIEHSMWLMFRQLDQRGGSYLKRHIEALGINVRTSERVLEILGEDKVQGVLLGAGETIACDTVVIAAGIVPNVQLIRTTGLYFSKGIRVDDRMRTNDPNIYAIGECAEHRKKIYGLVTPGYEQADVLAYNLNGGQAQYTGSTASTSLKILDYPVFSMGEVDLPAQNTEELRFQDHAKGIYRRLFLLHGRLRGVVAIGAWPGIERLQDLITRQKHIWPWQVSKFRKTGNLWAEEAACNVVEWSGSAVICTCMGVTRANLEQAQGAGACDVEQLSAMTGAATACGACRPLLANLLSSRATVTTGDFTKTIMTITIMALVILLWILFHETELRLHQHRGWYALMGLGGVMLGGVVLREVFRISNRN
jgi:nitrite reductase (NADH) large subunit